MAQEKLSKNHNQAPEGAEVAEHLGKTAADKAVDKQELDDDIDAILGEIDDVLEVNAEEFVKSFIQKGGQ